MYVETGIERVRLGRTDLLVSPIAFGTWQLGGEWGPTDEAAAITAIRHAADEGINLFDTAQGYGFGTSERLLVKALAGRPRDQVVIATKGGLRPTPAGGVERDSSPAWVRQGVEESLRALDTDYIDLYQVHWPDPEVPFSETAGALRDLVAEGKVRHVGASNFDADQMESFSVTLPVETLQPPYHLFRRDIEESTLPYARAHDIGVLVYGPLAHGLLSGGLTAESRFAADDWRTNSPVFKDEPYHVNLRVVDELKQLAQELGTTVDRLAVAWVLANPAVDVAIVGTRNPRHVDDAVAATKLRLDAGAMSRIDQIMGGAVAVGGPSPESV
jgi:aryl-alcohol dehydrogenase-like predicted oxidoreductase